MNTLNNTTKPIERSSDLFLKYPQGVHKPAPYDILELSSELQYQQETKTLADDRKKQGQFFTPPAIARFMASLFSTFPMHIKVLDPGAGIGTLSAAVCERIASLRTPRKIELVLYETDESIIPLLDKNMAFCRSALQEAGHSMSYRIHNSDFILSNSHVFGGQLTLFDTGIKEDKFNAVIMNPPYFKIAKDSQYAQIMHLIVHGQPNIYALFMALASKMLKPEGELAAITPRSFCNGLYFRGFRRWFFGCMSLKHIHLFGSRTDAFRGAKVLQESVITLAQRSIDTLDAISISTSFGHDSLEKAKSRQMPVGDIVDDTNSDMVIRIPENDQDTKIMKLVDSWSKGFEELGLGVSTGPVVMFRAKEFLLDSVNGQAPLLSVHNVRPFETIWPVHKKNKPIAFKVCDGALKRRLLLPTRNYVLLRRFSAKEERRRLTASCFLADNENKPYVALENHLNYVYHRSRELTTDEIYGIAALFNSSLLDRFFRTISGNTQVNATELRTMKFPDLETVARIGKRITGLHDFIPSMAEHIVLEELGINGEIERYLTEFTL